MDWTHVINLGGVPNNKEYLELMLKSAEKWFNELIHTRGYVYLNTIYEYFNKPWNVKNANLCIQSDIHFKPMQFIYDETLGKGYFSFQFTFNDKKEDA